MKVLHDWRGACGACEVVWPELTLIPVVGKVGKKHYELYARAYRLGRQHALSGELVRIPLDQELDHEP